MKVGTDGVLLGAWTTINSGVNSILDIGAGTGLIALMMAQRSNAELIDAVELHPDAYEEAVLNFEESEWADRLFCYHASFQEFVEEIDETYDLIVSNPPFYTSTFKDLSAERAMARHSESLSYDTLINGVSKLLNPSGSAAFIIPYSEEANVISLLKKCHLKPNRITHVRGTFESPVKRSLIQCSFSSPKCVLNELVIENSRHNYTEGYKALVKEFYLKM